MGAPRTAVRRGRGVQGDSRSAINSSATAAAEISEQLETHNYKCMC